MNLNLIKTLQPSGALDGNTANELRSQIVEIAKKDSKIIVIDFGNVLFINSSGIGALVATMKDLRSTDTELVVYGLNEQVNMIFKITKINKIFRVFKNRDEFQASLISASN